ncbi:hypothetical protein FOZ63_008292, partial [Perkinsus olseni]
QGVTVGNNIRRDVYGHEKSAAHMSSYLDWRNFLHREAKQPRIDTVAEGLIQQEATKWRKILRRLLAITLFLASRGLAFRGSTTRIGETSNRNFMGSAELLAQFDDCMESHLDDIKQRQNDEKTRPAAFQIKKRFVRFGVTHDKSAQGIADKLFGFLRDLDLPSILMTDIWDRLLTCINNASLEFREKAGTLSPTGSMPLSWGQSCWLLKKAYHVM